MTGDVIGLLVGLVLLTFAADRLVVSAARIGKVSGLSPILIGAVVVGLGTSLPEMLVSGLAAARPGGLDLAVGNIVGSNVANLALVLGVSLLLSPIDHPRRVLRKEGVLVLLGSLLLAMLAWNDALGLAEGVVLGVGLLVVLGLMVQWARQDQEPDPGVTDLVGDDIIKPGREMVFGLGALGLTLLGAQLLVSAAETIALEFGISEAVIGLTLVALGTSLPELATAIAAARRKENDLVLGNLLGSNLFNALGVGAVAGVVGGGAFVDSFRGPLAIMVGVTALTGILAFTGPDKLTRREGAVLLIAYPVMLALT
jgi:cation:H+ antiporter